MQLEEPGGAIQMAIFNVVRKHARTPDEIKKALDADPGQPQWTLDAILKCLRFLETHKRVRTIRREDGLYAFQKEESSDE